MEVNEIEVSVSKKVQESQYEPYTVHVGLTASLEDGENVDEAHDALYQKASEMAMRDLAERETQLMIEEQDNLGSEDTEDTEDSEESNTVSLPWK